METPAALLHRTGCNTAKGNHHAAEPATPTQTQHTLCCSQSGSDGLLRRKSQKKNFKKAALESVWIAWNSFYEVQIFVTCQKKFILHFFKSVLFQRFFVCKGRPLVVDSVEHPRGGFGHQPYGNPLHVPFARAESDWCSRCRQH